MTRSEAIDRAVREVFAATDKENENMISMRTWARICLKRGVLREFTETVSSSIKYQFQAIAEQQ